MAYVANYGQHFIFDCHCLCFKLVKGSLLLSNVEEMIHHPILDVLIDDGLGLDIEFGGLARNIKKEVCGVIDFILSFLTRYDEFSSYLSFKLLDTESS